MVSPEPVRAGKREWCGRPWSNWHGPFGWRVLSPLRLPVSPRAQAQRHLSHFGAKRYYLGTRDCGLEPQSHELTLKYFAFQRLRLREQGGHDTMPFELTIGQPPPNGVVIIGETTLVTGIATGLLGAEPVLVDSVTVQIGGGPPVTAELSFGATRIFKAGVVVPGPPGPVVVSVTAHYDDGRPPQTKSVTAIAAEGALTGCWSSDDGMLFFLSQNGNTLWWVGLDQGPGLQGQGLNITTVFQGAVNSVAPTNPGAFGAARPIAVPPVGLGIQGVWADVPRGTRLLSGTIVLQPESSRNGPVHVLNVSAQTGGFTASRLTRVVYAPPQQEDIQSLFKLVHKNTSDSETLASEGGLLNLPNLTAYKDPVVVFGSVAGHTSSPTVVANRRPTDGVTYADFICTHGGGGLDGDVTFDLVLDSDRLDPNFWIEGWEPGVDPQNFLAKVNANRRLLHLELVMFARNASCGEPENFNDPVLLPGWQEMGGDSVLINGRPLNGAVELQPVPGHSPPPLQVAAIGGKAIHSLNSVRVTGALVLDCGHTDSIGTLFDRCQATNASFANQEIHPVYAIDVIDATSQENLTGVWGDNYGMTYYLNQVGDTVWWFGMGPFRNGSLAQVFQGVATNGTIEGSWQDVPLGTGVSGEQLAARHRPHENAADGRFVVVAQRPAVVETLRRRSSVRWRGDSRPSRRLQRQRRASPPWPANRRTNAVQDDASSERPLSRASRPFIGPIKVFGV